MRAILLASGYGTRLKPLTDTIPKCLVPIKNKPLLEIWFDRLSAAGHGPFLVNTHYLSEQVEAFVAVSPYSDQITLTHENDLRGTAGTLIDNREFFNGEGGLLIHADNYCLADFGAFIRAHRERPEECMMTMMLFRASEPSSCGIVDLDTRGVVTGFHEKVKTPPSNLANAAVYCLSGTMIENIANDLPKAKDFSNEVLPYYLGRIYSYETEETLVDVGTPKSYAVANGFPDF